MEDILSDSIFISFVLSFSGVPMDRIREAKRQEFI